MRDRNNKKRSSVSTSMRRSGATLRGAASSDDKGQRRDKDSHGKSQCDVDTRRINAPEWYIPDDSIAKDTASIPYSVYNGVTYDNVTRVPYDEVPSSEPTTTTSHKVAVPGVAVYKYIPSYGLSTSGSSALNMAVRAIYTAVRRANAGAKNYEATDLALYILTMDQLYLMIHEAKRVLKLAVTYKYQNRDVPYRVARAMGYNLDDIVGNLANYRARVNTIIMKINTLAVPASFDLFKRRTVLGEIILSDDSDRTSQIIVPDTDGYYVYDANSFATGGAMTYISKGDIFTWSKYTSQSGAPSNVPLGAEMVWNTINNKLNTQTVQWNTNLGDMIRFIEGQLGRVYLDEDINIMSGDILKAYGESGLYSLPMLGEEEQIEISHDADLLEQFKNSNVLDLPGATLATTTWMNKWTYESPAGQVTYRSGAQFRPILFSCASPRARGENRGNIWSAVPVITQIDGILLNQPVIARLNLQKLNATSSTSFTLSAGQAWSIAQFLSVYSGLPSVEKWILDIYKDDPDYKDTLEYSRLIMGTKYWNRTFTTASTSDEITTVGTLVPVDQGVLGISTQFDYVEAYCTVTGAAPVPTSNPVVQKATYEIIHGTEIGLGWLVQLPGFQTDLQFATVGGTGTIYRLSANDGLLGKGMQQWFQFSQGMESATPAFNINTNTDSLYVGINTSTFDSSNTIGRVTKRNNVYAHYMMLGLDFGPRPYVVQDAAVALAPVTTSNYNVDVVQPGGKFGNKTALVSNGILANLHDTAILGLIARDAFNEVSK